MGADRDRGMTYHSDQAVIVPTRRSSSFTSPSASMISTDFADTLTNFSTTRFSTQTPNLVQVSQQSSALQLQSSIQRPSTIPTINQLIPVDGLNNNLSQHTMPIWGEQYAMPTNNPYQQQQHLMLQQLLQQQHFMQQHPQHQQQFMQQQPQYQQFMQQQPQHQNLMQQQQQQFMQPQQQQFMQQQQQFMQPPQNQQFMQQYQQQQQFQMQGLQQQASRRRTNNNSQGGGHCCFLGWNVSHYTAAAGRLSDKCI